MNTLKTIQSYALTLPRFAQANVGAPDLPSFLPDADGFVLFRDRLWHYASVEALALQVVSGGAIDDGMGGAQSTLRGYLAVYNEAGDKISARDHVIQNFSATGQMLNPSTGDLIDVVGWSTNAMTAPGELIEIRWNESGSVFTGTRPELRILGVHVKKAALGAMLG